MKNSDNKEKALNLLIEVYKLYAAFCAIIIAGLLSFVSSLINPVELFYLYMSVGFLSLCSIICVIGVQYFISKVYNGKYDIYSKGAAIIIYTIMFLLVGGVLFGFIFLTRQEKMAGIENVNKKCSSDGKPIEEFFRGVGKASIKTGKE